MTSGDENRQQAREAGSRPGGNRWGVLGIAFAPLVGLWAYKVFLHPRPFWAWFSDPEVFFFYTGVDLVEGRPPSFVGQPGTPMQVLTAIIAVFTGSTPLDVDAFRVVAYSVALVLSVVSGWLMTRTLLRDVPATLSVAALWTFFICPGALFWSAIWTTETLFFGFAGCAIAAVAGALEHPDRLRRVALAGAAFGVCIALKFTFVPLAAGYVLAVAVVAGPGFRARARAVAVAAGACVGGFVLGTLPAATKYPEMFSFITRMVTRDGLYGAGDVSVPTVADAIGNATEAIGTATGWHVWLALVVALVVVSLVGRRMRNERVPRPVVGLLVFSVIGLLGTYAVLFKTPNVRYLLAAGLLTAVLLAAAARVGRWQRRRWVGMAVVAVAAGLLGRQIKGDLVDHHYWTDTFVRQRLELESLAAGRNPGGRTVTVYSRRCPHPAFALGAWAMTDEQRSTVLAAFPDSGWHNVHTNTVHLPAGAERWDLVVLSAPDIPSFPDPLGAEVARIGQFQVFEQPE